MKSLTSRALFNFSLLFSSLSFADMSDITRIFHQKPTLTQFEVCQGGGCYEVDKASLSEAEWRPVAKLFSPQPESAEEERAKIALAIGLLEQIVGGKIGTTDDLAGTFNGKLKGQQDCNDEAINTTTYMRLLQQVGLLHFHEIQDLSTRNFFFTGWPHTTASMRDIKSGEMYAVDSWFYDNGHAATILPLAKWKDNYKPDDSPIGKVRTAEPKSAQAANSSGAVQSGQ